METKNARDRERKRSGEGQTAQFVLDLVGNSEDRFPREVAKILYEFCYKALTDFHYDGDRFGNHGYVLSKALGGIILNRLT